MLYELIGIVRPGNVTEVKEIVLSTGQTVLRNGGVIRSIANFGMFSLPNIVFKHQRRYRQGHYFVMRFDGTTGTQSLMRSTLAKDPRILRTAVVKLGDGKLSSLSKYKEILWQEAFERT